MSDAVVIALIGAVVATINVGVTAYVVIKVRETHDLVNGVSHELTQAQSGKDKAEAFTLGEEAQRQREQ